MGKAATRLQLLIGFVTVICIMIACFLNMADRYRTDGINYSNHEDRIKRLEDEKKDIKDYIQKVENKVDKVSEQNTQILILLQNKQDRK